MNVINIPQRKALKTSWLASFIHSSIVRVLLPLGSYFLKIVSYWS